MEVNPNNYKIKRIKVRDFIIRGKKYLKPEEEKELLSDEVYIEEKLDGKLEIKDVYEYRLFLENLTNTHTIWYKDLPYFEILLDIYNKNEKRFLTYEEKLIFALENNMFSPPLLYQGKVEKEDLKKYLEAESYFETEINPKMKKVIEKYYPELLNRKNFLEGVVVKKYKDGKLFAGKIVNTCFEKIIDLVGRYEKYQNKNKIRIDWERMKTYYFDILEKLDEKNPWKEKLEEYFNYLYSQVI